MNEEEKSNLPKFLDDINLNGNSSLAEQLRSRSANAKLKSKMRLTPDLPESDSQSNLIVIPNSQQKRILIKEKLIEKHQNLTSGEFKEEKEEEIIDDSYGDEEEEEEEEKKEINKENKLDPSIQAYVDQITKDPEVDKLSIEEIEKKLYEQIVNMRLTEDLEEIKQIIRIITGQWRSGRLRRRTTIDTEGLEQTFEGDSKEKKELENKRLERRQRRIKKIEERAKYLSGQTITQLVEKAMWVKYANEENAKDSDIYRGKLAMTSKNDPKRELLEKLEENAFLKERRINESKKKNNFKKNNILRQASKEDLMIKIEPKIIYKKNNELSNTKNSFSFISTNNKISNNRKPIKNNNIILNNNPDEKLISFLSNNK